MTVHATRRAPRAAAQISLLNIITELKKCCNHPFLFESAEGDYRCPSTLRPPSAHCTHCRMMGCRPLLQTPAGPYT